MSIYSLPFRLLSTYSHRPYSHSIHYIHNISRACGGALSLTRSLTHSLTHSSANYSLNSLKNVLYCMYVGMYVCMYALTSLCCICIHYSQSLSLSRICIPRKYVRGYHSHSCNQQQSNTKASGNAKAKGLYACMYVCMYACVYVCMYVCVYACMYVRMYVYVCVCMYVCLRIC